jgi:hypothetical protein
MTDDELYKLVNTRLNYDHDTGVFTWKVSTGRSPAGSTAGAIVASGAAKLPRRIITIGCRRYRASHLALLLVDKKLPKGLVDHINHSTLDDSYTNLREVTTAESSKNKTLISSNTSGVMGVSFTKATKRWRACIHVDDTRIHLGYFAKFDDAVEARRKAEAQYGFHPNHGK